VPPYLEMLDHAQRCLMREEVRAVRQSPGQLVPHFSQGQDYVDLRARAFQLHNPAANSQQKHTCTHMQCLSLKHIR